MPKCVHGQELQDFGSFLRGEDDTTKVLTCKLGASPGIGHSFSPGGRTECQRSLKKAPKGSPCFGESRFLPQEQCPELQAVSFRAGGDRRCVGEARPHPIT